MTTTQRPTFTQRGGDGAGFFYLLASGGASGSLNFDFTTGVLPGAITFTRASIGTYNSSGNILTTASANVARFNYVSGVACLLVEPAATNMFLDSNNFSTANWIAFSAPYTLTAAQFVSPDGSNSGWSMALTGNGTAYLYQVPTYSAIPYVISVWLKRITGTANQQLLIQDNPALPAFTTTSTLTRNYGSYTPLAGNFNAIIAMVGSTGNANGIYGAQLETGSAPTSYIPTTTAAVTRAADSATFTIPAGINQLVYTFDDNSTQTVAVSPGSYTIPTTLNRPNIKSVVGRYAFDFTGGSLPAGMTFTRPSIGTYVNNAGTLITAGNDVARFNYVSGVANLLIEGSATNLLVQSNAFSNASWLNNGIVATAAQFVSPDGSNNGWALASTPVNGYVFQQPTVSAVPYVISVWIKQITGSTDAQTSISGAFSGGLTISATLTRKLYTVTPAAGANATVIQVITNAGTIGAYGAQLETGSAPTSYIPTTTTSVTRAADSAVFTVPSGVGHLTYTFDDNSTQLVTVSAGSYTIPVTLSRPNIKSIVGSA